MTLTNRRTFIHGLLGFSSLAVGGCFSPQIGDDDQFESQIIEYPPIPDKLKVIHVWSDHRDAIEEDAAKLLCYPLNELNLDRPYRAECVMIDGANIKPYPFASIVCVEYRDKDRKLFWYDGYAKPEISNKSDLPFSGIYLQGEKDGTFVPINITKKPQGENLEVTIDLLRKARKNPGLYVYP